MQQFGSHWMDYHEIWYLNILRQYVEKIQANSNVTRIMGTLHEDLCIFIIISRSIIVRIRNFQAKVVEKINTLILCSIPFLPENRADYGIMWKNIVDPDRTQMATRWMGFGCWISKATDTFLEYVTVISFPQQQWLHERSSRLRLYANF